VASPGSRSSGCLAGGAVGVVRPVGGGGEGVFAVRCCGGSGLGRGWMGKEW
jgi:hypothetical protein